LTSRNKTRPTSSSVDAFIAAVENDRRRQDARAVRAMMERVTGETPRMWGDSIIGFGHYRYRRANGSRHDWMLTGLSPRKSALTVYIMPGFRDYGELLEKLGKHRHSVSCLYLTRLSNIDFEVLTELVRLSVEDMRRKYCGQDPLPGCQ
jgi:hypothetical protein